MTSFKHMRKDELEFIKMLNLFPGVFVSCLASFSKNIGYFLKRETLGGVPFQ